MTMPDSRFARGRLRPIPPEEWDDDLRAFVKRAQPVASPPLNFFRVMAHHPKLLQKWTVFAGRVLGKGILSPRDRELLVLRTVWNCGADYEWVHHSNLAPDHGLDERDIDALQVGPSSEVWDERERWLVQAADDLHSDAMLGEETFAALEQHYSPAELVEIVLLVGNYTLVSFFVRSFGVTLEEGVPGRGEGQP